MVGGNLVRSGLLDGKSVLSPGRDELDLLDRAAVLAYLREHRPDFIVHCAGVVGGIAANMAEPVRFLVDNLDIGKNLVLAARDAGVARLLNLSSSCVYPRDRDQALREDDVLSGPLEPTNEGYALAKIAIDRLCDFVSQEASAPLRCRTLVPCNLYGPGDSFDSERAHLVPAVIRKLHEARDAGMDTVTIWGDGEARREFMFVGDLVEFIGLSIDRFEELPPRLNVGVGHDHTINEYYRAIADVVGYRGGFVHDLERPVGMRRKLLDVSRMKALGWRPKTDLDQGVRATYDSFLKAVNP